MAWVDQAPLGIKDNPLLPPEQSKARELNHLSPKETALGFFQSLFSFDSYFALHWSGFSGEHLLAQPRYFFLWPWNAECSGLFKSQIFWGFPTSFKELVKAMWISTWKYFPINTEAILTIASQEEVTDRHGKYLASCWLECSLGRMLSSFSQYWVSYQLLFSQTDTL